MQRQHPPRGFFPPRCIQSSSPPGNRIGTPEGPRSEKGTMMTRMTVGEMVVAKSDETLLDAVIVGAGMSGLLAAIRLKQAGYGRLQVLERSEGLGGTWWSN